MNKKMIAINFGLGVVVSEATFININGRRECANNIHNLQYMKTHGPDMNPPATEKEMKQVELELQKQLEYQNSWVVYWRPPTVDWVELPMDQGYIKAYKY